MISESAIFGGDGCSGTDNLGNDVVSEKNIGAGTGWGSTTIDCGVNSDGNLG